MPDFSLGRVGLLGLRERRSNLSKRQRSKPLAHVNTLSKRLALDKSTNETTSESVTSTVGVNNLSSVNGVDREVLDGGLSASLELVSGDNNGVINTLGHNDNTGALGVGLGQNSHGLGNGGHVSGLNAVRLGVGQNLRLVTNDVVPVDRGSIKGLLEELGQEGSRQVHGEDLVGLSSVLTQGLDGRGADSQVETTNVVDLGLLNKLPVLGLLKMLELVVVSGSQISGQGAVGAVDQGSALTGRDIVVDEVVGEDTGGLVGLEQELAVLVLTDGSKVDNRLGRENVLGTTCGVLGSTTGDQDDVGQGKDLLVDGHVLLLDENGVVLLEVVLVKVGLVTKPGVRNNGVKKKNNVGQTYTLA